MSQQLECMQGIQYDPDAELARLWLPELSHLPAALRHEPWLATAAEAASFEYPAAIVDPQCQNTEKKSKGSQKLQ